MTRDEIIRMAREAGFWNGLGIDGLDELERFAALVAASEREACAKVCDGLERKKWETLTTGGELSGFGARDCAAAIRARGQE